MLVSYIVVEALAFNGCGDGVAKKTGWRKSVK
jgi:hypothetical protein